MSAINWQTRKHILVNSQKQKWKKNVKDKIEKQKTKWSMSNMLGKKAKTKQKNICQTKNVSIEIIFDSP